MHGETGHIASCLTCARILKARGDNVSFDLMTRVYDIIRLLPLANFDVNANTCRVVGVVPSLPSPY